MNEQFKEFMNSITEENLVEKVGEFISTVKNNYATALQTDIMFGLHNTYLYPSIREVGKSCSACRQRVWKRVNDWYNKNKID